MADQSQDQTTQTPPAPGKAVEPRVVEAKPRPEVNEPLLRWRAPEYSFYEKSNGWYIVAGAFAVALIIAAIFFHEWLGAVVVGVLALVIYQHAGRAPRELDYTITTLGVQVGEKLYHYNELKTFWVVYQPTVQTLNLALTRRVAPLLTIQLGGADPVQVKEALRKYLPEDEKRGEELADKFARFVRF